MARRAKTLPKRRFISRQQLTSIVFVVLAIAIVLLRLLIPLVQLAS